MDIIVKAYNTVFYERADPRVKDWLFMTSPWPLANIIASYLLLILVILPRYMKHRAAYELKTVIKWYNIMQILVNAVVSWGIATSGWTTTYHLGCVLPDYSTNPEPMRMLTFMWWTVCLKLIEFFETIFFILRKRDRQVSFLHVYHHIVTLIIVWSGCKYVGGGMTSFSPLINNSVHVIMYSYYLAASEGGPRLRAHLAKYKKWLTVLQMIQFTLMITYSAIVFLPSCPAPLGVTYFYFPNVIIIYYLFYRFYKDNYIKKRKVCNIQNSNGNKQE